MRIELQSSLHRVLYCQQLVLSICRVMTALYHETRARHPPYRIVLFILLQASFFRNKMSDEILGSDGDVYDDVFSWV